VIEIHHIEGPEAFPRGVDRASFVDFLHTNLGNWGDPPDEIDLAVNYAFSRDPGRGGFLLAACEGEQLAGAVVMNHTGMQRYVPEYLLVYIAVGDGFRNRGIGRQLVGAAIERCGGSVALHCEPDNPAMRLYQRLGFQVKYAELRWRRPGG
jgi:ribosomal-protein-alanine N-acetyltransferase